ncbi:pyridoxamine 5'-phosphate oxidase family protein [Natronobacterium texcoconense]|uniref:Pyridoxamine 5'-phosphate oxidase n=1 Tax=Natronobacterium texcoconense TaxID=1095778 RepID=A0A1H1BCY4_NATTX|nr:pyridoxamine 5'-phosphate oxidase [Natronobacterium texcoconense]SDQ49740.1 hypothetical protein SAMN04489842_1003 [Natronobacterium texcoconense]
MNVRGSLTEEQVVEFLESQTVPIRVACRTPSGHLWMLSLWYRRRDEADSWTLACATSANATVVDYLTHDAKPAVAFEVSTNHPPYRGVRGRGTASVAPDPEKETLRALLERYLDGTESELARTLLREEREEVTITIDPVTVYGWDFSERMRERKEQ